MSFFKLMEVFEWIKIAFYALVLLASLAYVTGPLYTQAIWAWIMSSLL